MPSTTSTSTTSPSSRSTAYWATEAPTLPAPTTVIFGRRLTTLSGSALPTGMCAPLLLFHVLDDGGAELRALDFLRAVHEPREIVRHDLLPDGRLQRGDDPVRRLRPAHVTQHHLAGENDGAGIDLVLSRVLGRRPVRGLEEGVPALVVDVGPGRDADAAHLRGERVRDEIARQVAARNDVELVRARQDLLQEGVGDGVLDEDLARGRLAPAVVPADELVGELALGQGVAPLHEHPFRVLLDVALVHERHVAAPVLDGVAHGGADQALRALLGHRLDADGGGLREPDLLDLHLLLEKLDDLLRLGRPLLPLDSRVDVLGVLPEDDHVDLLGMLDGRGNALEVAHGPEADVEVEDLAQRHVERAEALPDRRGQGALDGDQIVSDDVERLLGQEIGRAVLAVDRVRLLPGVDLGPRDPLLARIGLLDGGVQHPDRGRPDVRAGAVALDEGDDGTVRHLQLAVADRDLLACRDLDVGRHGIALPCSRGYFKAFRAEPALNHPICSSVRVCRHWMATVLPPGLWMTTSAGLPGASSASPVTLTRSGCSKRS